MISWLRYARHADVPTMESAGWRNLGPLPGNHGHWSVLMIWTGEGEPS